MLFRSEIASICAADDQQVTAVRQAGEHVDVDAPVGVGNDDQVERSNSPNRSVSRIAYVRVPSAVSAEEKAKLKAILVRYDATAMLILDVQQKRAPFQQRAGLKRLFQLVLKSQVDEILIANPTQLCNTKEGFELIEWTFHMIGARVLITPSLDVF